MPTQEKVDFLVLYGSQTGQAEAISEEIYERSFKEGLHPVRFALGEIEKKFHLEKLKYIVIVCSTTGEGEPPDNALKFVRRIKKRTLSSRHLQNLSFTILGLGDSNYTNFCNCSKEIASRLIDLGAQTFYEPGYGDDAVGLEEVVEPWIEGLFPVLRSVLRIDGFQNSAYEIIESANTENKENIEPANTEVNKEDLESANLAKKENTESANTELAQSNSFSLANNHMSEDMGNPKSSTSDVKEALSTTEHEIEFVDMKDEPKPNLRFSLPPLSTSTLKIPASPAAFLELEFLENENNIPLEDFEYPGAATNAVEVPITSARQLTNDNLVKKALEVELNVKGVDFDYQPGDSFGIVCQNKSEEVGFLIKRLNIIDIADKLVNIKVMSDTLKKAPVVPRHIHCPTTLRQILTRYVDFRAVPRKAFLRMLVDYTEDDDEKRRLQELCCVQGNSDYSTIIREKYIGFVQILQTFSTCKPPVMRVLELLPQLLPREYSVASYAGKSDGVMKFVFNVIELQDFMSSKRFGLCTSWLDDNTSRMRSLSNGGTLEEKLESLKIDKEKLNIYFRKPTAFRFPDDPSQPLIMIGPGTGVAPFIGFLEKREILKKADPSIELGPALLFFGCRYHDKDFLYQKELLEYKEQGILTELYCSFSRDEPQNDELHTKYVQHNIQKHKEHVLNLLFQGNGAVFICGDAKFMGRDVTNTFVDLIVEYKDVSKVDAIKVINELRERKQFLEDVWT